MIETRTRNINVRLKNSEYEYLENIAKSSNHSMSAVMIMLMSKGTDERNREIEFEKIEIGKNKQWFKNREAEKRGLK